MGHSSDTPSSPTSGKPCFWASKTPKRVRFATGNHLSGSPIESGTPQGELRSGIHSATAPLGREHHKDTATVPLGREHRKDTAIAPIGREQCSGGFASKFLGGPESSLYGHLKVRYTHLSVPPKDSKIPGKGKPIIVNNFASVLGVPINLEPPTKKGSVVFNRNQTRLDTCNDADEKLMSKLHLPTDLSFVFNPPVYTPDDEDFLPGNWFLKATAAVAKSTTPTQKPAPFIYSTETASVAHNTQLLKDSGYDFASIIGNNQDTSLSYNSKFRS